MSTEKNKKYNIDMSDLKGRKPEEIGKLIIEKILKIPGVKVNREEFLRKSLSDKLTITDLDNAIENGTSAAGISLTIIQKAAHDCISGIKIGSTAESAVTGLPGGVLGITAGLLTDLTQFYANLIILIQKLVYLYGMKDINSYGDIKNNDSNMAIFILIFMGAASSVETAEIASKVVIKRLAAQYAKDSGKLILLAKPTFYSIAKKVAKSIGVSITKKGFAKAASKTVPIIGAGISAALNLVAFTPLANHLNKLLSETYDKPFDENWVKQLEAKTRNSSFFIESLDSIKKYSNAYHKNKKSVKERKRENISQECLGFIEELCNEAIFCKPDVNIFQLVKVKKDDCFVCHDDTKRSHTRGFVITADGIHSFIDTKRQYHFISFKDFAEITAFSTHKHKSPTNPHKFIEARINNVELIPILPYEKISGGSKTIIPFLTAIRNACWVDLYL